MTSKEQLMKIFDDLENQKSKFEEFKRQQTVRLSELKEQLIKNLNATIVTTFEQFQQMEKTTTVLKDVRNYIVAYLNDHKGELFLPSDIVDIVSHTFVGQLNEKNVQRLVSVMIDKPSKKFKILRLPLTNDYVENLINSDLITSRFLAAYRRTGSVPFFTSILQDVDIKKYNTMIKGNIEKKFHILDKNTDQLLQ